MASLWVSKCDLLVFFNANDIFEVPQVQDGSEISVNISGCIFSKPLPGAVAVALGFREPRGHGHFHSPLGCRSERSWLDDHATGTQRGGWRQKRRLGVIEFQGVTTWRAMALSPEDRSSRMGTRSVRGITNNNEP